MKWFFWGATALILYTYFGYPAWLWVRSRWHSRPLASATFTPLISVVIVVRNEEQFLRRKLQNLGGWVAMMTFAVKPGPHVEADSCVE
jgi:hypothetical protein